MAGRWLCLAQYQKGSLCPGPVRTGPDTFMRGQRSGICEQRRFATGSDVLSDGSNPARLTAERLQSN